MYGVLSKARVKFGRWRVKMVKDGVVCLLVMLLFEDNLVLMAENAVDQLGRIVFT